MSVEPRESLVFCLTIERYGCGRLGEGGQKIARRFTDIEETGTAIRPALMRFVKEAKWVLVESLLQEKTTEEAFSSEYTANRKTFQQKCCNLCSFLLIQSRAKRGEVPERSAKLWFCMHPIEVLIRFIHRKELSLIFVDGISDNAFQKKQRKPF